MTNLSLADKLAVIGIIGALALVVAIVFAALFRIFTKKPNSTTRTKT